MIFAPALGGANKANRLLLHGLVQRGHNCAAIAPALGTNAIRREVELSAYLNQCGTSWQKTHDGVYRYRDEGVEVHSLCDATRMRHYVATAIRESNPDWVLVSSEDPGQVLLELAVGTAPSRVIYLVHTPLQLPFGPESFFPSKRQTQLLHSVAGIITVSQFLKNYIRQWSGLDAEVLRFPVYGSPGHSQAERRAEGDGFVTLINPCAYKGISIFRELAARFPHIQFAAVPTWGTNALDIASLRSLPNVSLLNPSENIDDVFVRTRILLLPSLWLEAFGLLSVEAMLRGIPVLASNVGGLPEAKLGVDYVLPVTPIRSYLTQFDEREYPLAEAPAQDITPWSEALNRLLHDPAHYLELSARSRDAASDFVASAKAETFEKYFAVLGTKPREVARRDPLLPQKRSRVTSSQPSLETLSVKERSSLQLRALQLRTGETQHEL